MARKSTVSRFWRGSRKHPSWDLGGPPNPRGKKTYGRHRRRGSRKWLAGLVLFLVLFAPPILDAGSLLWRDSRGCRVWAVTDGDTVRMHCRTQGFVSGRILGFDTPEMKARCPRELGMAVAATFYLRWQIWTARSVTATPRGTDRYGRTLTLFGIDGAPMTDRMVGAGLARRYAGEQRASWCE